MPIRDIRNITSFTSALYSITSNISPTSNINMVIDLVDDLFKKNCNNFDEVRGCFLASSIYYSRTLSLFLSNCNEDYTTRVQKESNKMVENDPVALSDSL